MHIFEFDLETEELNWMFDIRSVRGVFDNNVAFKMSHVY